ncbi:MAG TPA: hypothetical protein PLO89_05460 [Spirochaetota bacterium]|nr:hypothetical protein [Spirochaetota bacterium]
MSYLKYARYFLIFYFGCVSIFLLYHFNLFLFPKSGFEFDFFKIFYCLLISFFLSLYITVFIITQNKSAKILLFVGFFLALFYLQDFKRNFLITYAIEENKDLYNKLEIFASLSSIVFFSIACYFQLKFSYKKKNKTEKDKKNVEELFV